MAEYIERELILDAIAKDHGKRDDIQEKVALDIWDKIKKIPSADVVEVVRCKDCRHFCPYEGEEHKGDCNELVGLESCVYEDDFCSYGEAKMDGKDGADNDR